MTKSGYNILTSFVLTMAVIQAPLIYYYTFGMSGLVITGLFGFIGFALTMWLLSGVLNNANSQVTKFQKWGVILTIAIGSTSLFLGESVTEKLDWRLRRNSREKIVELVKACKLKPNENYNNSICSLDNWNFPPISNGGNEIVIYKVDSNRTTVEFFINRGFLDHYSAFIYTDDPEEIKDLEEHMTYEKETQLNKKLDKNWYRVSY